MSGAQSPTSSGPENSPALSSSSAAASPVSAGSLSNKRPSPPSENGHHDSSSAFKRPKLNPSFSMPPPSSLNLGSPTMLTTHAPSYNSLATSLSRPQSRSTSPNPSTPLRSSTLSQPTGSGLSAPTKEDPNDYSDALLSAGVNLREEEQLLSLSLPVRTQSFSSRQTLTASGSSFLSATALEDQSLIQYDSANDDTFFSHRRTPFLDLRAVRHIITTQSNESKNDAAVLISLACQEWLSNILTASIITSRYRRESALRNTSTSISSYSDVAKALRQIAIKDKELEEKFQLARSSLEIHTGSTLNDSTRVHDGEKLPHVTEEVMHRAANATAALMVSGGRKKYSWMTNSSGGGALAAQGSPAPGSVKKDLGASSHGIRIREAREEQGIVMRDLLSVLEGERIGVDKAITKGWTRVRD
ncbi:transcription initiation factor TFIID component TAF4 family-domain-containing protein [Lipomyces arxii]|uniref:transcription initiation factor TFIID component TAF4 family-domain-containing protein n=1 Tax=Lipomyces arxii TaxID=56418 RepID=UPI0034CF1B5F